MTFATEFPPKSAHTEKQNAISQKKKHKNLCSSILQSQCWRGGLPRRFGSSSSTGCKKSICAGFNRSMDTVSAWPPISIKNVFDAVCFTLKGPSYGGTSGGLRGPFRTKTNWHLRSSLDIWKVRSAFSKMLRWESCQSENGERRQEQKVDHHTLIPQRSIANYLWVLHQFPTEPKGTHQPNLVSSCELWWHFWVGNVGALPAHLLVGGMTKSDGVWCQESW